LAQAWRALMTRDICETSRNESDGEFQACESDGPSDAPASTTASRVLSRLAELGEIYETQFTSCALRDVVRSTLFKADEDWLAQAVEELQRRALRDALLARGFSSEVARQAAEHAGDEAAALVAAEALMQVYEAQGHVMLRKTLQVCFQGDGLPLLDVADLFRVGLVHRGSRAPLCASPSGPRHFSCVAWTHRGFHWQSAGWPMVHAWAQRTAVPPPAEVGDLLRGPWHLSAYATQHKQAVLDILTQVAEIEAAERAAFGTVDRCYARALALMSHLDLAALHAFRAIAAHFGLLQHAGYTIAKFIAKAAGRAALKLVKPAFEELSLAALEGWPLAPLVARWLRHAGVVYCSRFSFVGGLRDLLRKQQLADAAIRTFFSVEVATGIVPPWQHELFTGRIAAHLEVQFTSFCCNCCNARVDT